MADRGHPWIVYVTNESPNLRNRDVYLMRPDGAEAQRVMRLKEGSQDVCTNWAPDGRTIAITSDATGQELLGKHS